MAGVDGRSRPLAGAGAMDEELFAAPIDAVAERNDGFRHRIDVVAGVEWAEHQPRATRGEGRENYLAVRDALGGRDFRAFVDERMAHGRDRANVVHRDARIITAMRYTRAERVAQMTVVAIAAIFAVGVVGFVFRGGGPGGPGATGVPSATPTAHGPDAKITQETCCAQTGRFIRATWESGTRVSAAKVTLTPDPGFACDATVDPSGLRGTFGCAGLLKGATDYVARLELTTAPRTYPFEQKFKTMVAKLNH